MREIKFRAWNGERMRHPSEFWISADGTPAAYNSDGNFRFVGWKLMQYTGLKDKNGVEIYEGDIVQSSFGIPPIRVRARVYFEDGCFSINTKDADPNITTLIHFMDCLNDEVEVIGNIYENPELLER